MKHFNGTARRGMSLVEASIAVVIVGTMLVVAFNAVGASRMGQYKIGTRSRGVLLARDLLAEILPLPYEAPGLPPGSSIGPSGSEAATGDRSLFNDVDDYHGWSASPPQHKDGTVLAGFDGWERSVEVAWVEPKDFQATRAADTRVKRITVTVKHKGTPAAELVAVRTGW